MNQSARVHSLFSYCWPRRHLSSRLQIILAHSPSDATEAMLDISKVRRLPHFTSLSVTVAPIPSNSICFSFISISLHFLYDNPHLSNFTHIHARAGEKNGTSTKKFWSRNFLPPQGYEWLSECHTKHLLQYLRRKVTIGSQRAGWIRFE